MERDFMGLTVKQEIPDEIIDAAPLSSSTMQWSFSNKSSAPQLLSFHGSNSNEERVKTGFHSLASTGLVTITTSDAFDSVLQKNNSPEKHARVRHAMTTNYPILDSHTISSISRSLTNRTNLAVSAAMSQSFVPPTGQNLIGSISPQPLNGVPMANPVQTMPSSSPVVGTTDLRNGAKISTAPAQLTIFYNGSVCVYDNISPEKAQAIMLLAGNGPPMIPSTPPPAAPIQAPTPRSSVLEGFVVSSQPYGTTTTLRSSPIPSPVPKTSISHVSQYHAARPSTNNNTTTVRPAGMFASSSNKVEPLKVVNSIGSGPSTFLSSESVPQFRRKSLARFLEKRKERVISTSPYTDKQSQDFNSPGAGSTSLSANSSGSCPVPAIN
ncbi:hypothetical protein ACJIZ3_020957 [Penstemon smallii]|uniref:Protein TIFY n=1 Tax=Penstemon smallii TaxID=265156 RepID=A0ABD3SKQ5_9LAMI